MDVSDEILIICQQFQRAEYLFQEESLKDPVEEPYRSKYAAKEILEDVRPKIEDLVKHLESSNPNYMKCFVILASVYLNLAFISFDTEELSVARKYFEKCWSYLNSDPLNSHYILIALPVLNHLGILSLQTEDLKEAQDHLERAEQLYIDFKAKDLVPKTSNQTISGIDEDETTRENAIIALENAYTHTLFYLAQLYQNLNSWKAVKYCSATLKMQLINNNFLPSVMEWITNSSTLANAFAKAGCFKFARHHLALSSYMLNKVKEDCQEFDDRREEEYKRVSGYVARCWGNYGALLLKLSKNKIEQEEDENEEFVTISPEEEEEQMRIKHVDVSKYENQMTCEYVKTLEEAKKLFVSTQMWFKIAKDYFKLDEFASDHIEIVRVTANIYGYLAVFETDPERKYKMHLKRSQLLEPLPDIINAVYFKPLLRQLWYDIAVVQSELVQDRISFMEETGTNTNKLEAKINKHGEKSMSYFQKFIDDVIDPKTKELQPTMDKDLLRQYLMCHYHIAKIVNHLVVKTKQEAFEKMKKCYNLYSFLADYCDHHPEGKEVMKDFYPNIKEMVSLLPYRIASIHRSL